jgi:hypothetical protein
LPTARRQAQRGGVEPAHGEPGEWEGGAKMNREHRPERTDRREVKLLKTEDLRKVVGGTKVPEERSTSSCECGCHDRYGDFACQPIGR